MAYKVIEHVGLPQRNEDGNFTGESTRKVPGDSITKQEFKDHGQTDEDIQALVDSGAIEEA